MPLSTSIRSCRSFSICDSSCRPICSWSASGSVDASAMAFPSVLTICDMRDPALGCYKQLVETADKSTLPHDLADAVVVGVADIDRPIRADDRAVRAVEAGRGRGAAVAALALAAADDRRHDAGASVDPADRVVFGIDDQEAAIAVDRHFLRRIEHGGERRATIARIAAAGRAGDRRDEAGRSIDGAQAAALPFEDVDRAVGAALDRAGAENAGLGGG